jgi:glycerophosphoryl diester phosphodiesterase
MTRSLDIQGHRGARALFPENTLEGFLAATSLGVTAFELDVGLTADDVVVVTHDLTLNPDLVRDESGAWLSGRQPTIRSLTYAQLRSYDVGRIRPRSHAAARFPDQVPQDGACIPTLAAVLAALPKARFTIEVKTDPAHPEWTAAAPVIADAALAVIDDANAVDRVIVEAFDWRVQRHIRRTRADLKLAWLTRAETVRGARLWWDGMTADQSLPAIVAAEGGPVWAPDYNTLTPAQIDEAHRLGLFVLPWTVNRPADMRRLIAWGVDGLISDRPDLALGLAGQPRIRGPRR